MTMFRDFLDIRQDSRDIFEGLDIIKHSDVVSELTELPNEVFYFISFILAVVMLALSVYLY